MKKISHKNKHIKYDATVYGSAESCQKLQEGKIHCRRSKQKSSEFSKWKTSC